MSNGDLERQNELAEKLCVALKQAKELFEQLPTEDDLKDLLKTAERIEGSLKRAWHLWEQLPDDGE